MSGARRFGVHLLVAALALVVTGGSGASNRAPHDLRRWIDATAEVAQRAESVARTSEHASGARSPLTRRARSFTPAAAACASACRGCRARLAVLAVSRAERLAGAGAWPAEFTGRDVVAFKRARLI